MADRIVSFMSLLSDDVTVRWLITLLHFLWQGVVIGGVIALVGKVMRNASARSRYVMYSASLLSLPVCVVITFCVVSLPANTQSSSHFEINNEFPVKSSALPSKTTAIIAKETGVFDAQRHNVKNEVTQNDAAGDNSQSRSRFPVGLLSTAAPWFAIIYFIGVTFFLFRLLIALWGGHLLRIRTEPVTDAKLLKLIADQANHVKLKSVPVVAYCEQVAVPTALGVLRPMVLLPVSLMTGLSSDDFAAIIRHELVHIRRFDLWINLLQRIIESMLFFHPVVWFISRQLNKERELSCDDLVVSSGFKPMDYAGALLRVAELCSTSRKLGTLELAATGDNTSLLEKRIERLMNWGNTPRLQLTRIGLAGLLIIFVLLFGVTGIAHNWAQDQVQEVAQLNDPQREKVKSPKLTPEVPVTKKEEVKSLPETEKKLKWGMPVNGLRAAIAIRNFQDKSKEAKKPDLYLAVQNVSNTPIRLNDSKTSQNLRELYLKVDGKIVMLIIGKVPALRDLILQPREVSFVLIFSAGSNDKGKDSTGALFAEGALKDIHQSMLVKMNIDQAPEGAWTGQLVSGETSGAVAAGNLVPKNEFAQSHFMKWQKSARLNGNIPGGSLKSLEQAIVKFILNNPTDKRTTQFVKLLERLDVSRDWTQEDAVTLLDDVTAIYPSLAKWAEGHLSLAAPDMIRTGHPLPAELKNGPWGEAEPNGLRTAWLLDPRAEQYRLGTPLKSRILFHNRGKNTMLFHAMTWNQSGSHKARDANGKEIKISSTDWTTIPQVVVCRLAPGEYTEVTGAGIGIGANKDDEDWRGTRVGAWIEAKEGDQISFTPAPVPVTSKYDSAGMEGGTQWWHDFVRRRLNRELPLPKEAIERRRLLDRVILDLFGTKPTPKETAKFVSDTTLEASGRLVDRLVKRAGISLFNGTLLSGATKFRVLAVDPKAATKPRVATGPGRYTLGDQVRLVIIRKPDGKRRVNEAKIVFFSSNPKIEPPGKPYEIKLPDGYFTWAIAWERGSTILWVAEKGVLRSYDFTNPAQLKEMRVETTDITTAPEPLRKILRHALKVGHNSRPKAASSEGPASDR